MFVKGEISKVNTKRTPPLPILIKLVQLQVQHLRQIQSLEVFTPRQIRNRARQFQDAG
jgi:hypothetical protein